MRLEDIGFYTLSDERAKTASQQSDLQRCELILTKWSKGNIEFVTSRDVAVLRKHKEVQWSGPIPEPEGEE